MTSAVHLLVAGWVVVAQADGNATDLLAPARIAQLPSRARAVWSRYVAASDRLRDRDRRAMAAELHLVGRTEMIPGPAAKFFRVGPEMTTAWFAGGEARRQADNMLTFQTPSGGWSKRVDVLTRPRGKGESYFSENSGWTYIPTLDNDSTTEELRFLAAVQAHRADARTAAAIERGVRYLLQAQFPNGCWPQGYPLQGGYHDAATFNDNTAVNVLRLLTEIAAGGFPSVSLGARKQAAAAIAAGNGCLLDAQVILDGRRTVWAQQHDPLTLAPMAARSYELVGLAGRESAWITSYLMGLPHPDARVVDAVDGAVVWFRGHEIHGYAYEKYELKKAADGGPLWPRLTELETGRPIFSNRDGVKLYDWDKLTDRRQGYGWFGNEPAAVLEAYAAWAHDARPLREQH